MAFFPCVRFENQILCHFWGVSPQQKNWDDAKKLRYDLKLIDELHELYCLVTKLAIVCVERGLKLIIENPYSTQHFLTRYWCLKPALIDEDRRIMGDWYKKPTQYFFINFQPKHNFIFESVASHVQRRIDDERTVGRSMISPDYASRFIREYIL